MSEHDAPMTEPEDDVRYVDDDELSASQRRGVIGAIRRDRWRRWIYPLVGAWLLLLIVLFAVIQLTGVTSKSPTWKINPAGLAGLDARTRQLQAQEAQKSYQEARAGKFRQAMVGKQAPAFTLIGDDGRSYTLQSFHGRPLLIEFAASWCPHCHRMAPILDRVIAKHPRVRYVIVSANKEPHPVFKHWFETFLGHPMRGLLVYDDSLNVARTYGVTGYPTLAFINAQGKLVALTAGEFKPQALELGLSEIGA